MPTVTLGTRRLYDALGVETAAIGEFLHKVDLTIGKSITLYLGPTPPLGIMSLEGAQYGIPGQNSLMLHTNNNYEAPCFLEIAILASRDITPHQLSLLQEENKETREALLETERKNSESSEQLLDVISGILGLRLHRQLVLKPLVENSFLGGEFKPVSSFVGPAMEMLESIKANSNTGPHVLRLLEGMADIPEDVLRKGGAILHWLLKAWRERDVISKFIYLFIPLEAILQSTAELATDSKVNLESLEAIVRSSDVHDKESLLQFLDRAKTKFGPTLNSRFEEFARRAAIPGWELDSEAFKKYNRMRNLLLHAGHRNVRSHINFEKNTRTLEDLVERYVSIALLGSPDVYPSRWRPQRGTAAQLANAVDA
ncbi:MAG: hypothetical protein HYY11_10240 [Candidatus Methylomirabilis oxyfera]|nr:hypothetical protein [Candidatus Methylomirabilis oxyfera]